MCSLLRSNSTYFESVLNVKVPTMTSNTTPSGVASASSEYSSGYQAFMAFDGDDSSRWVPTAGSNTSWIQYAFPTSVRIYKFGTTIGVSTDTDRSTISSLVIASGETEGDLANVASYTPNMRNFTMSGLFAPVQGKYWRMQLTHTDYAKYTSVCTLQFYGRADV